MANKSEKIVYEGQLVDSPRTVEGIDIMVPELMEYYKGVVFMNNTKPLMQIIKSHHLYGKPIRITFEVIDTEKENLVTKDSIIIREK